MKYLKNPKRFWEIHTKAKEMLNKKLTKLPFSEKIKIVERLNKDYKLLQRARHDETN